MCVGVRMIKDAERTVKAAHNFNKAQLALHDVPQTVKAAVSQLKDRDVQFVTVHGNDRIIEAAAAAKII